MTDAERQAIAEFTAKIETASQAFRIALVDAVIAASIKESGKALDDMFVTSPCGCMLYRQCHFHTVTAGAVPRKVGGQPQDPET